MIFQNQLKQETKKGEEEIESEIGATEKKLLLVDSSEHFNI